MQICVRLPLAEFALNVDVTLPGQGITVVYGASGSGKTSLLRCVAGLTRAPHARVQVAGQLWQDQAAGVFVPTWRRPLGMVFQQAQLFEHLTVQGNLHYGLKRVRAPQARQVLDEAVGLLGIANLLTRRVTDLSGGERQRVAMARALATQPQLLLMDEPLAAIDQARRREVMPWLERLRSQLRIPVLYVTHAADELARLASQLLVLERGQVLAVGPVAQVLAAVDVPVVVGEDAGVLVGGTVAERDARWHLARVAFDGGSLWLRDSGLPLGQAVRLRVLARDVSITTEPAGHTSIQNHLPATVEALAPGGHPSQALLRLRCGHTALLARVTQRAVHELGLAPGMAVWLQVKSVALVA